MSDYTQFKSVATINDSLISDQLEANIIAYFDWGFLQAEGFVNVTFPQLGTNLRLVSDPDFNGGQVYESFRQGWIWESGVSVNEVPVAVSGVWVNSVFRPIGSGYHIDYPGGRVVFDTSLASGSSVMAEFSYRRVKMATADAQWFQDLQFNSSVLNAVEYSQFEQVASGAWNVLSQNRIQLPAIVVESVQRVRLTGLEIGSKARVQEQDILFHVLTETPFDRKQLHDIIIAQWDARLQLFDKNAVEDANAWPLDWGGTPVSGAMTYPQMVAATGDGGFRWRTCAITGMRSEPQTSFPPLYRATCRGIFEVDMP